MRGQTEKNYRRRNTKISKDGRDMICPVCGDPCDKLHDATEGEACGFCINEFDLKCYDPDQIRDEQIERAWQDGDRDEG